MRGWLAQRVGNEQLDQWLEDSRWLATVLRGESSAAASAVAEPIGGYVDNPTAQFSAFPASPPPLLMIRRP